VPVLRQPRPNQGAARCDPTEPTLDSWVQSLMHLPRWQEGMAVSARLEQRRRLPGWLVEAVERGE
jgi:hypothetical protein